MLNYCEYRMHRLIHRTETGIQKKIFNATTVTYADGYVPYLQVRYTKSVL